MIRIVLSIKKIHNTLLKLSTFVLVVVFTSTNLLISLFFSHLSSTLGLDMQANGPSFESVTHEFVTVVIFAPLIETLIHQYLIFSLLDYFKVSKSLIIIISALSFALIHIYSWFYIVTTFVMGVSYAYLYLILQIKEGKPFLGALAVHALYNLFAFLINNDYF